MKNVHPNSIWIIKRRNALITLTPFVLLVLFTFITGTVQAQTYTVLYEFKGMPDGYAPAAGLFRDAKGNLKQCSGNGDIWAGKCAQGGSDVTAVA